METNKRKIIKKNKKQKTTQRAQRNKSKATAQVTLIKKNNYIPIQIHKYIRPHTNTHTPAYTHSHIHNA